MTGVHIQYSPARAELDTARALVLRLEPDGDRDELVTALDERVRTLRGAFRVLSRNQ
jgi:hypothetical protein